MMSAAALAALRLAVLRWLLALPPCWGEPKPELASEREFRFERIANAITVVAAEYPGKEVDTAAMLAAIGWRESRFCRTVHSGERKGKTGEGIYQLVPASRLPRPYSGLDYSDTLHATRMAAWLIRHSYACGQSVERRMAVYQLGRCPLGDWSEAKVREWFYWSSHRTITKALTEVEPEVAR